MESDSAYLAAQSITIPVLVIHDENDDEVPVSASKNIYSNLKNGELLITNNLGHRKILGNQEVIDKTINFITKQL
jgi:pimeloyl-ACP methyl ester carboxylesterase